MWILDIDGVSFSPKEVRTATNTIQILFGINKNQYQSSKTLILVWDGVNMLNYSKPFDDTGVMRKTDKEIIFTFHNWEEIRERKRKK